MSSSFDQIVDEQASEHQPSEWIKPEIVQLDLETAQQTGIP